MSTEILSNGSKWAGQSPDPIEALLARLESETLDPRFEHYGGFVDTLDDGRTTFFGNFGTYSHVFNIITDDEDVVRELTAAIRANQQTQAYVELRGEAGSSSTAFLATLLLACVPAGMVVWMLSALAGGIAGVA